MSELLNDRRVYRLLEKVDGDLAQQAREGGCERCGEPKLHRGDYQRKPRGPAVVMGWKKRRSFNCSCCRKRKTPPSVRFLGRKVYAGVVVVLVGAMMHGAKPQRVERLREELGIDERTLKRWRNWWLEEFTASGFWQAARARFMPLPREDRMPLSLVDAFGALRCEGMVKLLGFLSPITVPSAKGGICDGEMFSAEHAC